MSTAELAKKYKSITARIGSGAFPAPSVRVAARRAYADLLAACGGDHQAALDALSKV